MTAVVATAADLGGVWGIGQWVDAAGRRRTWVVSHEEMRRDIGSATRTLAPLRVRANRRVLWCSMLSEAAQVWPGVVATMLAGAQLSCADATAAEAERVAMFCRTLEFHAVLGITGALLDGLDALGLAYPDVLGGIPVIGARPDAYARLRATGLAVHHCALVGPALAIGPEAEAPAPLDPGEWRAEVLDGHVAVTSVAPRATPFERARTAVRGAVTEGAVLPA